MSTLAGEVGWWWGKLTHRRCRNCGSRTIYSWKSGKPRIGWPHDYLCKKCSLDPKVPW